MATSTFEAALACLLAHEGGYSNHPADPGGPTKYGITIADYRRYVKRRGTAADVRAMTVDEAKAIYRAHYWDALGCDALPAGVDYAVFDYGVHSGTGRAGKVLRRLLALSDRTSAVTAEVVAAAQHADAKVLIAAICDERLTFLKSLKTWPVFGKGWERRVLEVRADALRVASKRPVDRRPNRAAGKAIVPVNKTAQKTSAAAVIASGGALASAHWPDGLMILGVVLATVALAIGIWAFWRWRQKRRQESPATHPDTA